MTLVALGRRTQVRDLVGMLAECHARIRTFLAIAARLASDATLRADEVRTGAHDVRRYFAEALPEHVADEELLETLLAGRDPSLDAVLNQMRAEHADHVAPVAALVSDCAAIEAVPERRIDRAPHLAAVVDRLTAELTTHLETEERELFPRLAALPADERERLREILRDRRDRVLAAR